MPLVIILDPENNFQTFNHENILQLLGGPGEFSKHIVLSLNVVYTVNSLIEDNW